VISPVPVLYLKKAFRLDSATHSEFPSQPMPCGRCAGASNRLSVYFIRDHQLEDATAMFLYCTQVDTWAKEAVKPSDQHVGI
jgi:hypothetical protein